MSKQIRDVRVVTRYNRQPPWLLIAAFVLALLAVLFIAGGEADEDLEKRRYCEMVALYLDDPSTGWPDYRGTYNSECRK
jgi:hypothetical protein